ncbi:MAG: ZIP family metal transporter [Planctomycetota bacterium]
MPESSSTLAEQIAWLLGGGLLMAAIALVGSVTLLLKPERLRKLLPAMIGLAAGSLLAGGALHMLPAGLEHAGVHATMLWFLLGFLVFMAVEAVLRSSVHAAAKPQVPLILIGDGLHNLIGGVSVGAAFLIDPKLGIAAWIAAAAHEAPQEIGDFGVLVDGGLRPRHALLANFVSALLFPVGALLSLLANDLGTILPALVAFGAGNFVYIAAVDLLPDVLRDPDNRRRMQALVAFFVGAGLLALIPHAHGTEHGTPHADEEHAHDPHAGHNH